MFDHAGRNEGLRRPHAVDEIGAVSHELVQLGFVPPRRFGHERTMICGTSLRISVADVLCDAPAAQKFMNTLCDFVASDLPVCLLPEKFPPGSSTIASWRCFCGAIRAGLSCRNLQTNGIGFCLHSHRMPLEAYCLIADSLLGFGARYVYMDGLQMSSHCDPRVRERTESNWKFLWRQRAAVRPVLPVYGGLVRSACRLLGDEVATAVIPSLALNAPAGTAWVAVGLPVTRFCTPNGQIEWRRLRVALRRAVDLADKLVDEADWGDPRQYADACANRRLAIGVSGLGDLLLQNDRAPRALDTLKWLTDLIQCIRDELSARSATLAENAEMLPALTRVNLVSDWNEGGDRDRWHQQWEIAARKSAVRHRNILVMSPSSVLPKTASNSAEFADLLPVLRAADAWSFGCEAKMPGWTLAQFRDFHRRARAIIQRAQCTSFVAAGV